MGEGQIICWELQEGLHELGGLMPTPKSLQQPARVTSDHPKEHSSGRWPNFFKEQQFLEVFSRLNASRAQLAAVYRMEDTFVSFQI